MANEVKIMRDTASRLRAEADEWERTFGGGFRAADCLRGADALDKLADLSVVAEDWEYGTMCPMRECTEPHLLEPGDGPPQPEESLWRRTRRREIPAGPWVPVEQEGENDG